MLWLNNQALAYSIGTPCLSSTRERGYYPFHVSGMRRADTGKEDGVDFKYGLCV